MNLNPYVWGPHFWFTLESIALGMPDKLEPNEIVIYKNFFESFKLLLPCFKCRLHYSLNLEDNPLTDEILKTKKSTVKWLLNLHNIVRKQSKQNIINHDETLKYYDNLFNNKKKKQWK